MLPDVLGGLPGWLVAGVALGGLLAAGAAAVFLLGVRLFPDGTPETGGPEGGERRRRVEVRRYLSSIDEPFVEDYPVDGRPAAFYLPRRGVAITFDARDYFRFERAGVRAVLLEYEFPGAGLGSRLPFETPESDAGSDRRSGARTRWRRQVRGDDGARPSGEAAFAALGLAAGASEDDVRAAYRDRVMDVHPDHGGDLEAFRRLREAYTVARRRAE